jgi:homoserine dehydrogenase
VTGRTTGTAQGEVGAAGRDARARRVGIVGFGTVGQAVARILTGRAGRPAPELRLAAVCNRRIARKRVSWVPEDVAWTERIEDVLASDADVVVELIGGLDPAGDWVRRALLAGKSVVTANKQLIAARGPELAELAARNGVHFRFEAAVCGGVPVLSALREGLSGDDLLSIRGVLNGTCNYILTRMDAAGLSFDAALAEAQARGFAEADPSADVDGLDAGAKLAILAAIGLGCRVRPSDVACRSIRSVEPIDFTYARRLGCVIRQVARVTRETGGSTVLEAGVQPALVPLASPLAAVQGSQNVVLATGAHGGETAFGGHGAGGDPTAVAVVSDLLAVARQEGPARPWLPPPGPPARVLTDFVAPRYVRFVVRDRPGIVADLAGRFSRQHLNIDAVLQEPGHSKAELPFVMTLEACSTGALDQALGEIAALDFHVRPTVSYPIVD